MIDDLTAELNSANEKAMGSLRRELAKIRTGRAHASMLDSLRVDYYGTPTPIGRMATVTVPEARSLLVKPWDKSQLKATEKAIRESDLGLNPMVDGDIIRVPVPPLSEERRRDLTKLARKMGEECRVALRHARHEAIDLLNELKKEGDASEDDVERAKKKVEEIATAAAQQTDGIVQTKEKDILEV